MQILDDFLPISLSNTLETILTTSGEFPWYLISCTSGYHPTETILDDKTLDSPQFVYYFKNGITMFQNINLVMPLYHAIQAREKKKFDINRMKSNLLYKNSSYPTDFHHMAHRDHNFPNFKSLLYYVNDSDGDTFFFNKTDLTLTERITPKKNRAVFFDSDTFHASSSPKETEFRVVVNMILEEVDISL